MNRDGHLDLVVASESIAHLTILFGAGDGTFPAKREFNNSECSSRNGLPNSLLIDNYNDDNIPDIVYFGCSSNNSSNFFMMLGNGDGNFQTKQLDGQIANHGAGGDYNEDGYADLAVNGGGYVRLLFGRGDGTFSNNNISFYQ